MCNSIDFYWWNLERYRLTKKSTHMAFYAMFYSAILILTPNSSNCIKSSSEESLSVII